MKKKELAMNIIMAIVMSAAMGALAAFLVIKTNPLATRSTPVPMVYISNIVLSVIVGIIVAFIVPLGKLGRLLAAKAGANPPGIKFSLINSIPLSVGNALLISPVVSFVGVYMGRAKMPPEVLANLPPLFVMWFGSWLQLLLPTVLLGYVLAVIIAPIVSRLVGMPAGGPPQGRGAPPAVKGG